MRTFDVIRSGATCPFEDRETLREAADTLVLARLNDSESRAALGAARAVLISIRRDQPEPWVEQLADDLEDVGPAPMGLWATAAHAPGSAARIARRRTRAVVSPTMRVVETADRDAGRTAPDEASQAWLDGLRSEGPRHDQCVRQLHALLLRTARREVHRRRAWLGGVSGPELDDVAHHAAADALLAIINNLDTYRGLSRFTTWSYRFVINHVSVKTRQHLWTGRRVMFDDTDWDRLPDRLVTTPHSHTEQHAQLEALRKAVDQDLTARQREVFVAVALNDVPIDVVAMRLDSNRGAIYKLLFDARTKLRASLLEAGYPIEETTSRP